MPRASLIEAFRARCEARAALWAAGELSLHVAVDRLQHDAERDGLVADIGQNAVQAIMAEAFVAARDDLPAACEEVQQPEISDDEYEGLSSTFAAACRKADAKQRRKPTEERIERLRELMADDISIERVYAEINKRSGVAASTVEALMLGLRERGIAAAQETKVRARLAQLSEVQLIEVGDRLQQLKPKIARAWSPDDVAALVSAWEEARL